MARAFTKQSLRKKDLEELENNREQDLQLFLFAINQPVVQKGLGAYIQSLKKKWSISRSLMVILMKDSFGVISVNKVNFEIVSVVYWLILGSGCSFDHSIVEHNSWPKKMYENVILRFDVFDQWKFV